MNFLNNYMNMIHFVHPVTFDILTAAVALATKTIMSRTKLANTVPFRPIIKKISKEKASPLSHSTGLSRSGKSNTSM